MYTLITNIIILITMFLRYIKYGYFSVLVNCLLNNLVDLNDYLVSTEYKHFTNTTFKYLS